MDSGPTAVTDGPPAWLRGWPGSTKPRGVCVQCVCVWGGVQSVCVVCVSSVGVVPVGSTWCWGVHVWVSCMGMHVWVVCPPCSSMTLAQAFAPSCPLCPEPRAGGGCGEGSRASEPARDAVK